MRKNVFLIVLLLCISMAATALAGYSKGMVILKGGIGLETGNIGGSMEFRYQWIGLGFGVGYGAGSVMGGR